jgi:hypothetical protein
VRRRRGQGVASGPGFGVAGWRETGIRATARIPTNRLEALPFGPLTDRTAHICIDMQNVFAEETSRHTPWMARAPPGVTRIAERHPSQTVFTRFIPPRRPDRMPGSWQRYYERWRELTLERIDPRLISWSRLWRRSRLLPR